MTTTGRIGPSAEQLYTDAGALNLRGAIEKLPDPEVRELLSIYHAAG